MKNLNQNCSIGTVNTVAESLSDLIAKSGSKDATFLLFGKKLGELSTTQNTAIKKDRIYSELDPLDSERDSLWRAAFDMAAMYKKNPVKTIQEGAAVVCPIFEKYGRGIAKKAYDEESAYITSAQTDLSAESAAAAVKKLPGLSEVLENLWAKNSAFKAKTAAFLSSKAVNTTSASALKKEIVSLVNALIAYVDSVGFVRDDLKGFEKELSERIARANA